MALLFVIIYGRQNDATKPNGGKIPALTESNYTFKKVFTHFLYPIWTINTLSSMRNKTQKLVTGQILIMMDNPCEMPNDTIQLLNIRSRTLINHK